MDCARKVKVKAEGYKVGKRDGRNPGLKRPKRIQTTKCVTNAAFGLICNQGYLFSRINKQGWGL